MNEISNDRKSETEIRLYKRPLFIFNKEYNDIYITNKVPLCVYYKRAIELLRWRLSNFSSVCKKLTQTNSTTPEEEMMGNKKKNSMEVYNDNLKKDAKAVLDILSKRNVPFKDQSKEGIRIHAAGSCIKKALYVLQDLFEYTKNIYLDAQAKYVGHGPYIRCSYCEAAYTSATVKSSRSKHALQDSDCEGCKKSLNEYLENLIKRILHVTITIGSIHCVDDVWKFKPCEIADQIFHKFDPLVSPETDITISEQRRVISCIRVSIDIPTNLDDTCAGTC